MVSIKKKQFLLSFMAIIMVITSLFAYRGSITNSAEASLDPASKLLCAFEDGQTIVNFQSTDYPQYITRSKSAVTSTQNVESDWLNKLLMMAGYSFGETNEAILGRPLNPTEVPEEGGEDSNKNSPKVSAFDRFGMAGLKWSSYQGEWKYYHVEACSNQDKVSPTNFGAFYEGRLDPKSPYNEVATSVDNRSVQFNKGVMSNFVTAFSDTLANGMFFVTKAIVTLTIVFVGLSFTDITTFLGMMEEDGTAGATATGIFSDLYNGLFSGFVVITFMFTALYIMYKGLIRRELRFAMNTLIKTILIFIVAGIMAANPSFWIGIPNKVTTYGQALMLSTMSSMYEEDGQYALCSTEVSSIGEGVNIKLDEEAGFATAFEKTNENMRSMIGCKMWEVLLFKPWVKGQFGADYEELDASNVRNENEEWVGKPTVPLGADTNIENWALFHLSTQTNAHSQIGGGIPTLVSGVNSDWWRVADALSNYEEEKTVETDEEGTQQEFEVPVKNLPTPYWQSWVGNNEVERLFVALISILFGIVGSIAPLVFGLASAVYGVGITLLMMISPVFLLLGTWGGKGDAIFFGWLGALTNTIIKKIMVGLLLVMSLTLSMIIMDMMSEIGFIESFLLMCVVSLVLIKNKDNFLEMVAKVDFGGAFDPRVKANQFFQKQKSVVKEVSKVGTAALVGSTTAAQSGQSIFRGARLGVERQLENRLQTTKVGREVIRQTKMSKGGEKLGQQTCIVCHMPLGVNKVEVAYEDDDGNYYCVDCADEKGLENLYEVIAGDKNEKSTKSGVKEMYYRQGATGNYKDKDIRSIKGPNTSWVSHDNMRKAMQFKKVGNEYEWNDEEVQKQIFTNFKKLREDAVVYKSLQLKLGRRMVPPSVPAPLTDYIDTALINLAWSENRYEVVEETYKAAWTQWYEDNSRHIRGVSDDTLQEFKKQLEEKLNDTAYQVTAQEAQTAYEKYFNEELDPKDPMFNATYKYYNGEIVLINESIHETDELLSD